jgi:hypothetical protein
MKTEEIKITVVDGVIQNVEVGDMQTGELTVGEALQAVLSRVNKVNQGYFRVKKDVKNESN